MLPYTRDKCDESTICSNWAALTTGLQVGGNLQVDHLLRESSSPLKNSELNAIKLEYTTTLAAWLLGIYKRLGQYVSSFIGASCSLLRRSRRLFHVTLTAATIVNTHYGQAELAWVARSNRKTLFPRTVADFSTMLAQRRLTSLMRRLRRCGY